MAPWPGNSGFELQTFDDRGTNSESKVILIIYH